MRDFGQWRAQAEWEKAQLQRQTEAWPGLGPRKPWKAPQSKPGTKQPFKTGTKQQSLLLVCQSVPERRLDHRKAQPESDEHILGRARFWSGIFDELFACRRNRNRIFFCILAPVFG